MDGDGTLSWFEFQKWLEGRLACIERKIDERMDGIEERLRSVEGDRREERGRHTGAGGVWHGIGDWARYLVAGIVGALASRYIGH